MERLNLASFIFLVVLFVLMPRAALRSARQLRQAQGEGKPLPRLRIMLSTMFSLAILWFLAAMNAVGMGSDLFAVPTIGWREVGIGVAGLALLLAAIPISRAIRTPEEERRQLLFGIAPRDGREYAVFAVLAVMAGIAEEAAYRGVAVWTLTPIFGGPGPAIFLSAMAFAVVHAVQGGKAMAIIFGIALVLQGIVQFTGTLVIAMIVHAIYDLVAGAVAMRRVKELAAAEPPGNGGPGAGAAPAAPSATPG